MPRNQRFKPRGTVASEFELIQGRGRTRGLLHVLCGEAGGGRVRLCVIFLDPCGTKSGVRRIRKKKRCGRRTGGVIQRKMFFLVMDTCA